MSDKILASILKFDSHSPKYSTEPFIDETINNFRVGDLKSI